MSSILSGGCEFGAAGLTAKAKPELGNRASPWPVSGSPWAQPGPEAAPMTTDGPLLTLDGPEAGSNEARDIVQFHLAGECRSDDHGWPPVYIGQAGGQQQ